MTSFANAMKQLQEAASRMGVSVLEAATSLSAFAKTAQEVTFLPGDASREYKTLNPKHEVI